MRQARGLGLIWKGRQSLAGKRRSAEQITNKLCEAEAGYDAACALAELVGFDVMDG